MIKSMTGFGKRDAVWRGTTVVVEIRSVNHRFREVMSRLPKGFLALEEDIKRAVGARCQRGHIDVVVTWTGSKEKKSRLEIDRTVAKQYYQCLRALQQEFHLDGAIDVSLLAGLRGLVTEIEEPEELRPLEIVIKRLVTGAIRDVEAMRVREGKVLLADMKARLGDMRVVVKGIGTRVPQVVQAYYCRMRERIEQLVGKGLVESDRLNQELAHFADRCDVTEEMTRFTSHLSQFEQLLKKATPVGRQLDFLLQEMGREVNTIGSKANDIDITSQVVYLKSELEKVREQVQNVE